MTTTRIVYYRDASVPSDACPVVPRRLGSTEATPRDSMVATRLWLALGIALLLLALIATGAGLVQFPDVAVGAG